MMKIALVSPYDFPYPGGVTEHITALANSLRHRGHQVQIIAASSGYQGEDFPHTQVITRRVTKIPVGGTVARVGLSPFSYRRIKKLLQNETFDVIHLQEPLTPSLTWWVLLQAQALRHTATIGTFHAYHEAPNWLYARGRPIFAWLCAKLDARIAVSAAALKFARQTFPGDYSLIPNGIDLQRFGKQREPGQAKTNHNLTILYVGRLDWRKGFHTLLDSFIKLKPHYPGLRLQVVGPFEAKDYAPFQELARTVTGVEFVGYVPPERLPDYYHQADIFCAPSLGYESFGIVLLEAMAAGLPLVASDIFGYRSVIQTGQDGLLVTPGQTPPLVEALSSLIDHPEQRQALGQRGWLKAQSYGWDKIIEQVLSIYQQTVEEKYLSSKRLWPLSRSHHVGSQFDETQFDETRFRGQWRSQTGV